MAVWEVGPPRAVASATMRLTSSAAVSDGVRSSATRITGPSGISAAAASSSGARRARTRRPTSRRSAARAASSGLLVAAMRSAVRLTASRHAQAGPWPSTINWQARVTRSVSARNSACALKMPASAAPRRRPVSSASVASCCFVATIAVVEAIAAFDQRQRNVGHDHLGRTDDVEAADGEAGASGNAGNGRHRRGRESSRARRRWRRRRRPWRRPPSLAG